MGTKKLGSESIDFKSNSANLLKRQEAQANKPSFISKKISQYMKGMIHPRYGQKRDVAGKQVGLLTRVVEKGFKKATSLYTRIKLAGLGEGSSQDEYAKNAILHNRVLRGAFDYIAHNVDGGSEKFFALMSEMPESISQFLIDSKVEKKERYKAAEHILLFLASGLLDKPPIELAEKGEDALMDDLVAKFKDTGGDKLKESVGNLLQQGGGTYQPGIFVTIADQDIAHCLKYESFSAYVGQFLAVEKGDMRYKGTYINFSQKIKSVDGKELIAYFQNVDEKIKSILTDNATLSDANKNDLKLGLLKASNDLIEQKNGTSQIQTELENVAKDFKPEGQTTQGTEKKKSGFFSNFWG